MATEQLEAELVAHAAWESAGMARMLRLLLEFDRRQAWASWQCVSAVQWLSWKCGLGPTAAGERLRVARALEDLPTIRAAFEAGLLSWSKVRELTRVATVATDAEWANIANHATAAQVAVLVRARRRVSRDDVMSQHANPVFSWRAEPDGSVSIHVRLPAEQAMAVVNAVQAVTPPERGVPRSQSLADGFARLVSEHVVVSTEVVVHVDTEGAGIENGPRLAPEVAAQMSCEHGSTTVSSTPSGEVVVVDRRRTATKRQRRWLAKRHPVCQFPGCSHEGGFEVHHVVEHRLGGPSRLGNFARLCGTHHRLVHLNHLRLSLDRARRLHVDLPDGRPLDRSIDDVAFTVDPPSDPHNIGGNWGNERYLVADVIADICAREWHAAAASVAREPAAA